MVRKTVLTAVLAALGCGDSSASPDEAADTDSDAPVSQEPQYLVGGILFNPDGETSYGTVVPRLQSDVVVSLQGAITLPGRASVAVSPALDGTVFVGSAESPTISKYRVSPAGEFSLEDELSLAGLGLTTAQGNQLNGMQIVTPQQGYLFDNATLSVVRFNPQTMIIEGEIPLDGLRLGEQSPALGSVIADGSRLVVSGSYRRADGTADVLSAAAFLDTQTDTVTYASHTRCSDPVWAAKDARGNIYYASHPAQGGRVFGGVAGSPAGASCLSRIRAGASGFDDAYFVDLVELTGRPAGALVQGAADTAYTLVFDDEAVDVTPTNAGNLTLVTGWSYYSLELGNEAASLRRVEEFPRGSGIAIGFTLQEGPADEPTPFVIQIEPGFEVGNLFDVADPTGFTPRMSLPGIPFGAFRIR